MMLAIQKFLAFVLSFLTALSGGSLFGGAGRYSRFTDKVSFSPLTAQEMTVTAAERAKGRDWYETNILYAGTNGVAPAYDFSVDGVRLSRSLDQWTFSPGEESEVGAVRRGGKTAYITLTNEKQTLTATVEAAWYEDDAACEWTVTVENAGAKNSGVISEFYALRAELPVADADVYCSRGSDNNAADFTLLKAKQTVSPLRIACEDGRSTGEFLPYFNLSGKQGGAVLGVGWTGLWAATFQTRWGGKTRAEVKQKELVAYLEPGEAVRSPLVSLRFYGGANPVKGFNAFRDWVKDCVYPENAPAVQNNMDILFVSSTRTAAEIFYDLNNLDKTVLTAVDNFWMDAGWYSGCEDDWADGVGNWMTGEERFPEGIKAISDYAAAYDTGLVLWYEPERLTNRSYLYSVGSEHDRWLVDLAPDAAANDHVMWNLAEPEARDFLTRYISDSLTANGVTVYRQDFNYSPAKYWEYADKNYYGRRKGVAENHYITNLYTYLDTILTEHPGMLMDNCASGGKRLDLEMARRSVPMWRSDYNCDQTRPDLLMATQAHTYALSFWLPISGTFINFGSEYGLRSSIMPILQTPMSTPLSVLTAYAEERTDQQKQFFPVAFGGVDEEGVTAMQYGDAQSGCLLFYHHAKAPAGETALTFSGLTPDARYTVWSVDTPEQTLTLTGAALMRGEYTLTQPEGEKAFVIRYAVNG